MGTSLERPESASEPQREGLTAPSDDTNVCFTGSLPPTPLRLREWVPGEGEEDPVKDRGADVSLVDDYGDTILHLACRRGDVEMVRSLLSLNVVDIDARNKKGRTAADVARDEGHGGVVKLLVSRGAH
ncbi:uncharacterized protein [Haliotis cracherodii]|uniref:uncharacterized protein n=1 Tax=Haliotis cracherodii TaxID=6455 RepID=UPI0039ED4647